MERRTRIAKGIYRDRFGLAATVKAGGRQREKRFPLDASMKTIKGWQNDTRAELRKIAPTASRGTFAADAAKYLQAVAAMPTYKERKAIIDLWIAEFGSRLRASITTAEIDAVLARWLAAKKSPSTVRNRRGALLHLWNLLDPDLPNPVKRAMKPTLPEPTDRALSYPAIEKILSAMPDVGQGVAGKARDDQSKTKARLCVIAYTGLPHALVKKLKPEDIDWQARTIRVPRRHKGKGVKARTLPLTDAGFAALRRFAELECFGPFSNSSMLKSFQRACKAAGLPEARVYDLRHAFATELYRQTGDPKATAEMLMHAPSSRMMDRYTIGGVEPRLRLAVGAFNKTGKAPKWLAVVAGSEAEEKSKNAEAS